MDRLWTATTSLLLAPPPHSPPEPCRTLPHDANPADYNFDHPSSIDFDLLADHLERLRGGQDVDVPHYDFATHSRTGETTHVVARATSVIILDGIFVLWADRVAAQCDLTIFCSEDLDVCLVRRCVWRGAGEACRAALPRRSVVFVTDDTCRGRPAFPPQPLTCDLPPIPRCLPSSYSLALPAACAATSWSASAPWSPCSRSTCAS
jgi:hypothetical protein